MRKFLRLEIMAPMEIPRLYPFIFIGLVLVINLLCTHNIHASEVISYRVKIEGIADGKLRKLLESVSNTISRRQTPAMSLNLLRKRAERDIPRFQKVLKSQGYYAADLKTEIKGDGQSIQVIFRMDTGPPFLLESLNIRMTGENDIRLQDVRETGLFLGERVRSKAIADGEKHLLHSLRIQGYPFPRVEQRKVIVDHATRTVTVDFLIEPGPEAFFGSTDIKGLQSVEEIFVRRKIPWKEGERFNADLLTLMQNRLNPTGLFTMIQVKTAEEPEGNARLPMIISVRERKHRTVKLGINYKTDEGPGGKASWEHRNFFRQGERLNTSIVASGITYAGEAGFRKPGFMREDQSLILNFRLAEDHPDAFTSRNISSSFLLERGFSGGIKMGGGFAHRSSQVNQLEIKEGFNLISLPVYLDWDTSNDLLDPTRGTHLALQFSPFYDIYGSEIGFVKAHTSCSHYATISKGPFLVLAGRAILGFISGAERDAIPADIRFYAGGGGSIRGYAYQSVGPLLQTNPIGGRSLMELSAELRIKVTESIGLVTFIDGGSAFEEVFPELNKALSWGTGMGLRYFTPVGPIRFDVGVPLNRREGIDNSFQLYISLGQAF
ncbi:MAG: autotransporter assembly complex protein TamA [bacterium]